MILAIISNKEQYHAMLGKFPKTDNIKIVCDNPSFYDFLTSRNINFEILDEKDIKNSWASINTWACEKALLWRHFLKDQTFLNGVELNKALYLHFSFYLVSLLKNYFLANFIYKKYNLEEVIVFDNVYCPEFPKFNGV